MNTLRRALLALTVVIGLYVGLWAAVLPRDFYTSFPGFGLHWIDLDGPYNEHLVRDVGGLHLALGVAGLAALLSRDAAPGRVVGLAWAVFGALHLAYHVRHLEGTPADRLGTMVSLGSIAMVGLALLLPLGSVRSDREAAAR